MKVLVVGSSGFVGSNLNLDRPNVQFYGLDISEQGYSSKSKYSQCERLDFLEEDAVAYIRDLSPDFIVLLAGIQFTYPIQKRKERQAAFAKNIEIANQAQKIISATPSIQKIIFVSTDMVYGLQTSSSIDENCGTNPIGEYGRSKLEAENILLKLNPKAIILRPRLIVGPGRVGTIKLISRFVSANLPIPFIGTGDNKYQMISVFDLWSAIEKCFISDIYGIYNLGSDQPPTLNELFPKVLKNLTKSNKIVKLPRRITEHLLLFLDYLNLSPLAPEQFLIAGQNCVLNTEKFKVATGWKPKDSDEEIITQTLRNLI